MCPQTYGSISVCQQMAELQPQMKMTIRVMIPSPKCPIQGNKDLSRGYGPVLEKASSPHAYNTSVNIHPGGILVSALLQVHAAISLSFLVETHTLAAWNRCLLLPGTHLFVAIIFLTAVKSTVHCIPFYLLYYQLVVSFTICCEMTLHNYKTHQMSSVPQMHC